MKRFVLLTSMILSSLALGQDEETITVEVSQSEFDSFVDGMANDIQEGRTRVGE